MVSTWETIYKKIEFNDKIIAALAYMEESGGEPDVITFSDEKTIHYFVDCSKESPIGRRSLCYDQQAWDERKDNKPTDSALRLAEKMGITILDEIQYRALQSIEKVDLKTSSWIKTPLAIRELGGAIFGDRRYDHVFIYHNGAQSYYAARGFRACIAI